MILDILIRKQISPQDQGRSLSAAEANYKPYNQKERDIIAQSARATSGKLAVFLEHSPKTSPAQNVKRILQQGDVLIAELHKKQI